MAVHFYGLGWSVDTIFVCPDTESLNSFLTGSYEISDSNRADRQNTKRVSN